MECDSLNTEMEKVRADVVNRLSLGHAEMKRLTAQLGSDTRELNALVSKSEQLMLEVRFVLSLAN